MLYKTFTIVTILFFCQLNSAFNLLEQQPSNYFPVKLNQNSVKLKCQFDSQVKFCEWRRSKDDKQCNWSNKSRVIFIICFRFYQYWNDVKSWLLNANQQFTRQCRTFLWCSKKHGFWLEFFLHRVEKKYYLYFRSLEEIFPNVHFFQILFTAKVIKIAILKFKM